MRDKLTWLLADATGCLTAALEGLVSGFTSTGGGDLTNCTQPQTSPSQESSQKISPGTRLKNVNGKGFYFATGYTDPKLTTHLRG